MSSVVLKRETNLLHLLLDSLGRGSNFKDRKETCKALKVYVGDKFRELSSESFQNLLQEIAHTISDLISSTDPDLILSGCQIINELLDISSEENNAMIARFGSYLRIALDHDSPKLLKFASKTLGRLAKVGGSLSHEIVEFETKEALSYLQDERKEGRIMAAVLIMIQISDSCPTIMSMHIGTFFERIWFALRDKLLVIRQHAVIALRKGLELITQRDERSKSQWFKSIYDESKKGFKLNQSETIHGSLLVMGELFRISGDFMKKYYEEICELIISYKEHKDKEVKKTVIELIPELAKFDSNFFINKYLKNIVKYLHKSLNKLSVDQVIIFNSLGKLSVSVGISYNNYVETTLIKIRKALNSTKKKTYCPECIVCFSLVAEALHEGIILKTKQLNIISSIFNLPLSEEVIDCCLKIKKYLKELSNEIDKKMYDSVSSILGTALSLSNTSHSINVNKQRNQSSMSKFESEYDFNQIILSLRCLTIFEITLRKLLEFTDTAVLHYLNDSNKLIRKEAALTCCKVLIKSSISGNEEMNNLIENSILNKLLVVAITDTEAIVRLSVLESLDSRLDHKLCTSNNISALLIGLNDENFAVRYLIVTIIGRISKINPRFVIPSVRKTLIQLLTELEFTKDLKLKEESAKLLAHLIKSIGDLIEPYCELILKNLIPKLNENKTKKNLSIIDSSIMSYILSAIGQLSKYTKNKKMEQYLNLLMKIILPILQEETSNFRLFNALHSLRKIISSTAQIFDGYQKFPKLLIILLKILRNENSKNIRQEVMKLMGILGAIDPYIQKINLKKVFQQENKLNKKINSERSKLMLKKKEFEKESIFSGIGSNYSNYYPNAAIPSLMKILEDKALSKHHIMVIQALIFIFKSLALRSVKFLSRVMPTYFYAMRTCENKFREFLFKNLRVIVNTVKHHICIYLKELFEIISQFWSTPLLVEMITLIGDISVLVPDQFKVYLPNLIPQLLSVLRDDNSIDREPTKQVLKSFELFASNLEDYMHLVIPTIIKLFEQNDTPLFIKRHALKTIGNLCRNLNFSDFSSRIIHPIARSLSIQHQKLQKSIMNTLCKFVIHLGNGYSIFVPMIDKILTKNNIDHPFYQNLIENFYSHGTINENNDNQIGFNNVTFSLKNKKKFSFEKVKTENNNNNKIDKNKENNQNNHLHQNQEININININKDTDKKIKNNNKMKKNQDNKINENESDNNNKQNNKNNNYAKNQENEKDNNNSKKNNKNNNNNLEDSEMINYSDSSETDEFYLNLNSEEDYFNVNSKMIQKELIFNTPVKKLILKQQQLKQSWEIGNIATKEEWGEWIRRFSIELLKQSPSPTMRSCSALAQTYYPLAKELFNVAFLSCWQELYYQYQDDLIHSLEIAYNSKTLSSEVLQMLLNLAEFMEHVDKPLPISISTLGILAVKCRAYTKALHYKEIEFQMDPEGTVEPLITINNQLEKPNAAIGILIYAQQNLNLELKEEWYEQLNRWDEALEAYENRIEFLIENELENNNSNTNIILENENKNEKENEKEIKNKNKNEDKDKMKNENEDKDKEEKKEDKNKEDDDDRVEFKLNKNEVKEKKNFTNQNNFQYKKILNEIDYFKNFNTIKLIIGKMRCLEALGDWEKLYNLIIKVWDNVNSEIKKTISVLAANSTLNTGRFDEMKKYVNEININTIEGNYFQSIVSILDNDFNQSKKYIETTRELLYNQLHTLLSESYSRAYNEFIRVQQLSELEEIIEYKKQINQPNIVGNRRKRKKLKNKLKSIWKKRLLNCTKSVDSWQQLLSIHSLIIKKKNNIRIFLKFANICRKKENNLPLSERVILNLMKNQFNVNEKIDVFDESFQSFDKKIAIEYLIVLWSKNEKQKAYRALKQLCDNIPLPINKKMKNKKKKNELNLNINGAYIDKNSEMESIGHHHLYRHRNQSSDDSDSDSDTSSNNSVDYSKSDSNSDSDSDSLSLSLSLSHSNSDSDSDSASASDSAPDLKENSKNDYQKFQNKKKIKYKKKKYRKNKNSRIKAKYFLTLGNWYLELNDRNDFIDFEAIKSFELATRHDPKWYKGWHNWALLNSKIISEMKTKKSQTQSSLTFNEINNHLIPAIKGFFKSISLNQGAKSVPDTLRLLTLWIENGKYEIVGKTFLNEFTSLPIEIWLRVIPQIIGRINTPIEQVREIIFHLLNELGKKHPQSLVYQLNVAYISASETTKINEKKNKTKNLINSNNKNQNNILLQSKRSNIHTLSNSFLSDELILIKKKKKKKIKVKKKFKKKNITENLKKKNIQKKKNHEKKRKKIIENVTEALMEGMRSHSPHLIEEANLVSNELIRIGILWEELWYSGIEDASRELFGNENYIGMIKILKPLHAMIEKGGKTMREISFIQLYLRELIEAKEWCEKFLETFEENYLNQAWNIYCNIYQKIHLNLPNMNNMELKYISPKLKNVKNLELAIPGTYWPNSEILKIKEFSHNINVILSKQRPRKLKIYGNDGKVYQFLLKGHEDPRLDERVMQLFGLVNTLLGQNIETSQSQLRIKRYSVVPLSTNSGLIGWVPHTDTLHVLISEYRNSKKIALDIEDRLMTQMAPDYEKLNPIQKLEVFLHALDNTTGQDIYKVLWLKSSNSESWLERRTNYTTSLALTSMVGYILGLGDRHPSNLMMERFTGKIIHIDFGDCFEVTRERDLFPEKIPFRLTRMLIKAMEVSGIEGSYRITCQNVIQVLRDNKESLMAMLETFIHDPLIGWKLLDQKREINVDKFTKIKGTNQNNIKHNLPNFDMKQSIDLKATLSRTVRFKYQVKNVNEHSIRLIKRINDKLTGNDFNLNYTLDVPEQVQMLIEEATSYENLCQCYIGWCPFW
ncbi:serine/threonine-protein kinase mtor [Anaeramoeba flamelloides]|uniref:Serine/threonine-protein kinase TOR n=1 Tax=Anaeramoeba flamelloides TaxID=1746091 RepID=A0AAV8AE09_9EUKA|nr:serine/threonine-protein kinase mtor [Anaeramoeba flamelloides]